MSCILRITGEDFDVDDFISQSQINPYKVFYKGDPVYKTQPNGKKSESSGCAIMISSAEFSDFKQQVADAIGHLNSNAAKLKFIKSTPTIQYAVLDFGVDYVADKFVQTHYFPTELLQVVADLGICIELSAYKASE